MTLGGRYDPRGAMTLGGAVTLGGDVTLLRHRLSASSSRDLASSSARSSSSRFLPSPSRCASLCGDPSEARLQPYVREPAAITEGACNRVY